MLVAERIRAAVAAQVFKVHTSREQIGATISMGVATFPEDGADPNELVHRADLAVYRAKLQARGTDPELLSEWQIYPDAEPRKGAWAAFQYLVRAATEDGVEVSPEGRLKRPRSRRGGAGR